MPLPLEFQALSHWFKAPRASKNPNESTQVTPGDGVSARQYLSREIGNDAGLARLRSLARSLNNGQDLCRLDEHQLIDCLTPLLADGRLHFVSPPPLFYQLVPVSAPVAVAAPAAPAPTGPRAAPAPAPEPAETTFAPNLGLEAMVAVLRAAARDGVPFCEECASAEAHQQAVEAASA